MKLEISLQVDKGLTPNLENNWLRAVVRKVIKALGLSVPVEVSLVITDAKKVRQLNKEYRSKDESTDVLAFAMMDSKDEEKSFVTPPDGVLHLGEVVISYPQAVRQARELGHSVEQEMACLIVHGILHLLGYDHELPDEEEKMRAKEREVMAKIGSRGKEK